MAQQVPLDPTGRADNPERDAARDDATREICPDVAYRRLAIVNVVFFGKPGAGDRQWVLIDAGVVGTTRMISSAAERWFGRDSRPAAIVLTHGYFDPVGRLEELADHWEETWLGAEVFVSFDKRGGECARCARHNRPRIVVRRRRTIRWCTSAQSDQDDEWPIERLSVMGAKVVGWPAFAGHDNGAMNGSLSLV